MKRVAIAAADAVVVAKFEKNRRYPWCRLWNGFLDAPILRVVAERTNLPLHQVQALVARLEGFANAAQHRGYPRGYVGDFNAAEFGAAQGMKAEDAARIFASLEHVEVGWIEQDHVAGFDDRNRDREDAGGNERKQASRDRARIRKILSQRYHIGAITSDQRDSVEAILELFSYEDLALLTKQLRRGVALEPALSTCHSVTTVTKGLLGKVDASVEDAGVSGFSTGRGGHTVTDRDIGTVPPRADHIFISPAVDNSGDSASGDSAGLPKEGGEAVPKLSDTEAAELYLATKGKRVLVERLDEIPTRVDTRIARWRQLVGDDPCVLADIIDRVSMSDLVVARFLVAITDAIERHRREGTKPQLKLGPALAADNRRRGHG